MLVLTLPHPQTHTANVSGSAIALQHLLHSSSLQQASMPSSKQQKLHSPNWIQEEKSLPPSKMNSHQPPRPKAQTT